MDNVSIYSVGTENVYQKWQFSKTKCFASILREGLTCETLTKYRCLHPVLTLLIPVMQGTCITSRDAYSRATHEKTSVFNLPWVFTHTLSLSQLLQINPTWNTGYIVLNIITIKFGTESKLTKHIVVITTLQKGYQASDIISPMFEWIHCQTQRCTVFF